MDVRQATSNLSLLPVRLRIAPQEVLKLPALNKSNTLRGAFGVAFRRLVCIPQCREARRCPLDGTCPYRVIFEPSPPPGGDRLSKYQDLTRPFIFRPPLDATAIYQPGQTFDFILTLVGKAVDYLPYFILAFREVAREGIGLNRARCELECVEALRPADLGPEALPAVSSAPQGGGSAGRPSPSSQGDGPSLAAESQVIYTRRDDLFRSPPSTSLADWIDLRLRRSAGDSRRLTVTFLTPTYLKSEGAPVRQPEFHHLFKRVRDRLNALSTFYGPGPIDADFKGLGEAAEKVRTVERHVQWVDRSRRSSKTGQRHELSGFVGECTYDLSTLASQPLAVDSFLPWLLAGELIHVGRHTAWGNGRYELI